MRVYRQCCLTILCHLSSLHPYLSVQIGLLFFALSRCSAISFVENVDILYRSIAICKHSSTWSEELRAKSEGLRAESKELRAKSKGLRGFLLFFGKWCDHSAKCIQVSDYFVLRLFRDKLLIRKHNYHAGVFKCWSSRNIQKLCKLLFWTAAWSFSNIIRHG